MTQPTVADASALCRKLGARGVIVLAFDEEQFASGSYGMTRVECRDMAALSDAIFSDIRANNYPVWSPASQRVQVANDADAARALLEEHPL